MTRRSCLQRTRQRKMILTLTTTKRSHMQIPCVVMPPCKTLFMLIPLLVLLSHLRFQEDPSKKVYLRIINQQLQYLNSFPSGVIAFHSSSWIPSSTIQRRRHHYFDVDEGRYCWQRRETTSKQLSPGSPIYSINNDWKSLSFLHHGRIQQQQHYSLHQRPSASSSDCLITRLQAKRNENEEEDNIQNDDSGGMVKPLFVKNSSASGSGDSSIGIEDDEDVEDPVISARAPVLGVMNTIETKLGEEDSLRRSASSSNTVNDNDMLENDDLMFFSDTPPLRSSTLPPTTKNEPPKKEPIKKRGFFSRFFGGEGGGSSTTTEPKNGSSVPPKQEKLKGDAMKENKALNPSLPLVNDSMTSSDTKGSEKADKSVSSPNTVVFNANQKEELPVVKTATSTLFPSPSRTKGAGASATSAKVVSSSPPASDLRAMADPGPSNSDNASVPVVAGVSNSNTNSKNDNLIKATQNSTAVVAAAPTAVSTTNNNDSKEIIDSTSNVGASAAPTVVVTESNSETGRTNEEAKENPSSSTTFSSSSDADGKISKKKALLSWITPFRNTYQATQQAHENENEKSDDDIRRERLKDLEDDRRPNSNNGLPRARAPPSLRRLLERETLRLGEAAEVFNISSTAAILIEQAQTRKRALIRNVEQASNRGTTTSVSSSFDNKQVTGQKSSSSSLLSKFVRVFLSPAGWSGKFKYVSFVAFLLLAAPLPKRFSVMEPSSENFYGEGSSNWNKQKYYHRYDDNGRQTAKLPEQQQSTSLEERPTKYAAAATDQSSPSAQAIEEQRHYISSFVAKAVRKVGPSVIRIDTERYVDGPVLGGGRSIPPPSSTPFFGLEDFDSGDDDDGTQHGGGSGGVDQRPIEQGQGSGIIFSEDGLVLTNAHVVEGASRVTVTLTDGRRYVAEVKGQDEMVDLAVLQMVSSPSSSASSSESISGGKGDHTKEKDGKDGAKENKKEGTTKQQSPKVKPTAAKEKEDEPRKSRWEGEPLPVAVLGNSEAVEVGEWVIAVGNPVGLDNTVTMGIISSIKRSSAEVGIPNKKVEFIQTDAAINPGNSGGPLVNEHGDIIGINTCIRANAEGIGFAIPINKAKSIMYELAEGRNIQHGYIGIVMTTMTPDFARQNNLNPNSPAGVLPERNGALVMRVMSRTPASECGLRRFDVVVEMNGEAVSNASEAQAIVDAANVGDDMKLKILRGEKEMLLTVKPGDLGQKIREAKERQQQRLQQQQQQLLPPQQMIPPGMFPQGDGQGGRIFIFPMMPSQ